MKKMQEPELKVVTYELNDIVVGSGDVSCRNYYGTTYGNDTCTLDYSNNPNAVKDNLWVISNCSGFEGCIGWECETY